MIAKLIEFFFGWLSPKKPKPPQPTDRSIAYNKMGDAILINSSTKLEF